MSINTVPLRIFSCLTCWLFSLMLISSCSDKDIEIQQEYLVSASLIESLNVSELQTMATTVEGFREATNGRITQGVDVFKIVYNSTDGLGQEVVASGMVIMPQNMNDLPILSFQREVFCYGYDYNSHRYPLCRSDVYTPTVNPDIPEIRTMKVVAAAGYITVIPDFLGYGESTISRHGYEHGNSLAEVAFDMIMATREFIAQEQRTTNDQLFLSGYGSGGYATMALHKFIEDNSDLSITMSAPAAGLYDKELLANTVLGDLTFYGHTELMTSFIYYDHVYGLNRHSSVRSPYVYSRYTDDYALMASAFLNGEDQELIQAVRDNNRSDWFPKGPITMYLPTANYSEHSEVVLHENTRSTYESLKSNGATIQLIEYPDENAHTMLPTYMLAMYDLFQSRR